MKLITLVLVGVLGLTAASVRAQVTEAQIASIIVTVNQVDINAGKLAELKASNEDIKTFAQQMITDHTGINQQMTKLNVTPQDNLTSYSFQLEGEQNIAYLKTLSGAAFDRAYIDQEVTYHYRVLKAIDEILIPGAQNVELKALLVKMRPVVVTHLEHAKQLREALDR